jgi:hypothetical protein
MWKSPVAGRGRSREPAIGRAPADSGGLEYGLESDHPRPVENTRALSSRRDMFLDERGTGLRVTWHPERDLVVLSVWQDDRCVGTFRMSVQDVPRLSGLLAAALGDWVGQTGPFPGIDDPEAGGRQPEVGGRQPEVGGLQSDVGGLRSGVSGPRSGVGGGDYSLSMQQRLRLSRPVLKLRGFQHRRRRLG